MLPAARISLIGTIEPNGAVSAAKVRAALAQCRPLRRLQIFIHSTGGLVAEAMRIAKLIGAHRGETVAHAGVAGGTFARADQRYQRLGRGR